MSFEPVFDLAETEDIQFKVDLCLFCQKEIINERSTSGRTKSKNEDAFQGIINSCNELVKAESNTYLKLYDFTKSKSPKDLVDLGVDYHAGCRRTFNRVVYNLSRKKENNKRQLEKDNTANISKGKKLTRSQVGPFSIERCLFCQDSDVSSLHSVMQDSMDKELKSAFDDCPNSLEIYRIRWEGAFDAVAREVKYHRNCWNKYIRDRVPEKQRTTTQVESIINHDVSVNENSNNLKNSSIDKRLLDDSTSSTSSDPSSVLQRLVLLGISRSVEDAISNSKVFTIRNVMEEYKNRLSEHNAVDSRDDRALRKLIKRFLQKNVTDICFETFSHNESQRIRSKNIDKMLYNLAEKKAKEDTNDEEINVLRQAADILRRETLKFKRDHSITFQGHPTPNETQVPDTLFFFYKWLLAGNRGLNDKIDSHVTGLASTLSQNLLFNIKSDRQATYKTTKEVIRPRHSYTPNHQICLGLSLRHSDRNNVVLNLLSAPNYGYTISPRLCLQWETSIANSVIKNIAFNNGVYIPPNMVKEIIPMFHLDNIDWLEDTPDGKNTTHYLILSIFQRRKKESENYCLDIVKPSNSLKLNENSFNELLSHEKPNKNMITRSKGSSDFDMKFENFKSNSMENWLTMRSLEYIIPNYIISTPHIREDSEDVSISQFDVKTILPSFSATNSLIKDIDLGITNVFTIPLIPGPASSYSAIYTALKKAQGISTWTCSSSSRAIVSLDLDLYEKAYQLVNSDDTMKNHYILCLGELHIVFAHIRAIGSFLNSSGIEDAWTTACWFDSQCVVRQVLECCNMKRALEAHEATLLTISHLIFKSFFKHLETEKQHFYLQLFEKINLLQNELENQKIDETVFKSRWNDVITDEIFKDLEISMKVFIDSKTKDKMFSFLLTYSAMVKRLFLFIEASRIRNWEQHLFCAESLIPDLAAMDRIKYRRMLPVYISEMYHLKENDSISWNALKRDFSCQKTSIPGTAIGRDHCGEQENRRLKTRGGITGITKNDNRRTIQFLVAPVLSSIFHEMTIKSGINQATMTKHHQLNNPYIKRQNKKVSSLLEVFERFNISFDESEEGSLRNIITGQLFPDDICDDILQVETIGKKMYKDFIEERMKPDSTISIFAPLKKASIKTFKSANKSKSIKVNSKMVDLKENCNLFSRCAVIQEKRRIDMRELIGIYELTVVPPSLFKRDGALLDGFQGKSKLVERLLNYTNHQSAVLTNFDCVVIDAMFLLNQINPKPQNIKNGRDLAREFLKRVFYISSSASLFVIAFDQYQETSMKTVTREKRGGKSARRFVVDEETSIEKVKMSELLSSTQTKSSLVTLIMNYCRMNIHDKNYIIAGDNKTQSSFEDLPTSNNHEEADTLMIHCLCIAPIKESDKVLVYANDTDVFALLLKHFEKFPSRNVYMKGNSMIDISHIHSTLGQDVSSCILSLHALTGCDITGKFAGKSKEFWTNLFIDEKENENLISALLSFQHHITDDASIELERFICSGYISKKSDRSKFDNLTSARYFLFTKFRGENDKLPPTLGAFKKHIKRAFYQLSIWSEASESILNHRNPADYGWSLSDDAITPETTDVEIAPKAITELISCKCEKNCSSRRCKCKRNNISCTDFCGCNECENVDVNPSGYVFNENNDDVDVLLI